MISIFISLRDLHTNYILPAPYAGRIASLPFRIEAYGKRDAPHYIVTAIAPGLHGDAPVRGRRRGDALERHPDRPRRRPQRRAQRRQQRRRAAGPRAGVDDPAADDAARGARGGLDRLDLHRRRRDGTTSALRVARDRAARRGRRRQPVIRSKGPGADALGEARRADRGRRAAQQRSHSRRAIASSPGAGGAQAARAGPRGRQPRELRRRRLGRARTVTIRDRTRDSATCASTPSRVTNLDRYMAEVQRILAPLPQDGLIVDVRGNGGGVIAAGEMLLQLFTPRHDRARAPAASSTRRRRRGGDQPRASPGMSRSPRRSRPATPYSDACRSTPRYAEHVQHDRPALPRPGVLIVDALCYSDDRHLRGRLPGPRDRAGDRRRRQHRRRRRERLGLRRRDQEALPDIQAAAQAGVACASRSAGRRGSAVARATRSRTSASCRTSSRRSPGAICSGQRRPDRQGAGDAVAAAAPAARRRA